MKSSVVDPGCLFRIPDPDLHQEFKEFILQKFVSNLSEIWSGMFIPYQDPDLDFYPSRISGPGVKKAPDPGSSTLFDS
jgi:hypothetical protein